MTLYVSLVIEYLYRSVVTFSLFQDNFEIKSSLHTLLTRVLPSSNMHIGFCTCLPIEKFHNFCEL